MICSYRHINIHKTVGLHLTGPDQALKYGHKKPRAFFDVVKVAPGSQDVTLTRSNFQLWSKNTFTNKKYRNVIIKCSEMMGISYAVNVYDIAGSTELCTIYFATRFIFMANICPGYL